MEPTSAKWRARGRRGGWRQQLAAEAEDTSQRVASRVAFRHLLKWGDGEESAYELHQHMGDAQADGVSNMMVATLCGIGRGGAQHCHEGLMGVLRTCGIPQLLTPIPGDGPSHVLLPSSLISLMHKRYAAEFKKRLGADAELVRQFWVKFFGRRANRELADQHPVLRGKSPADLGYMVPCTVHEDAGPYSKTKSCDCISFSSLLCNGGEKTTKFLSSTFVKTSGTTAGHECWRAILRDFDDLATGVVNGVAVAQNADGTIWTFVLFFAKADQGCQSNAWGLPSYGAKHEMCTDCLANRTSRPFTDLRGAALWRPTEAMPLDFFKARPREPLHPLVASAFDTRWFCYSDLMHLMDCKGVASLVYGGVLFYLLKDRTLGGNRQERLDAIHGVMAQWYDDHPGTHRLPKLFLSNCVQSGWAELHGPAIKAANTRAAAPVFQHLCHVYMTADTARDRTVLALADCLVEFYNVLYDSPMFLSDAALDRFKKLCVLFGEQYQTLRGLSLSAGELAWPVRPKCHKMQHLPLYASVMNPTAVQCYAEESLVGTTTKCWKRSMSGRYRRSATHTVLTKRLVGLLCRFETAWE